MSSKELREALKRFIKGFSESNIGNRITNGRYFASLCFTRMFTDNLYERAEFILGKGDFAKNISTYTFLLSEFFQATIVSDLYLKYNHALKIGEITEKEQKLLEKTIRAIGDGNFRPLLGDIKTIDPFLEASVEFSEASAIDKIELYKSLDEKDLQLLSSFNPCILDEYKIYNVEITEELLFRHIRKLYNHFNDQDQAIMAVSQFIINLFKENVDLNVCLNGMLNTFNPDQVMQAILDGDVNSFSAFLSTYFNEQKKDNPTLK